MSQLSVSRARELAGLKPMELATRAKISPSHLSNIEAGRVSASHETVMRLWRVLHAFMPGLRVEDLALENAATDSRADVAAAE